MAENKGYMTLSDEQGSIHISEEVIAAIAVGAVREVEGVSGMMGNLGTSVADLVTNKKGAQKNAKGVKIEMTETGLVLDIYLTVAYGHAIPEVAENAQKDGAELLQPTVDTVTYSDGTTEEVYGFDIPVTVIDQEFDLALIGKKGVWYDHKVSIENPVKDE